MPHIHDKIDFTIGAFLVFQGKVLLVNHPRYGTWLAPGGHIELDEDSDQALFREIEEETGFKQNELEILSTRPEIKADNFKSLYTPNFINIHEANPPHRHITLIYFLKVKHDKHKKSDEHTDARWFDSSMIDSAELSIWPATKFYAKEAIKMAASK